MAAIDRAAAHAMERDLLFDPKLKTQYGVGKPSNAASLGKKIKTI